MYLGLLMQKQFYILFFISKPITDKTKRDWWLLLFFEWFVCFSSLIFFSFHCSTNLIYGWFLTSSYASVSKWQEVFLNMLLQWKSSICHLIYLYIWFYYQLHICLSLSWFFSFQSCPLLLFLLPVFQHVSVGLRQRFYTHAQHTIHVGSVVP